MSENNSFSPFTIRCGGRLVSFDKPALMGILNVTQDSFYDGGRYLSENQYIERARQIVGEGADIIDIGVVSTRPGAILMDPADEAEKLAGIVAAVRRELPEALISVDTCFSVPAMAAVAAGADIVNDISGGAFDDRMFSTVAELQAPYVLMHNLATPDKMQEYTSYDNFLNDVVRFFSERLDTLRKIGVADVILDPGFGFSKNLEQNYELFAALPQLRMLFPETPLLVAVSRKSMIYKLLGLSPQEALNGTVALHAAALLSGAQLLRVHDVAAARQTVEIVSMIQKQSVEK